jgi:hypothetical protein
MKTLSLDQLSGVTGGVKAVPIPNATPGDLRHIQPIPNALPDEWKKHLQHASCSYCR